MNAASNVIPIAPPLDTEAAMKAYLTLMRPAPVIPDELTRGMQTAIARKESAEQRLAAAERDVVTKRALEASYKRDVQQAVTAIAANENIEQAERLANAQRIMEARHRASQNILAKSTSARDLAAAEVQSAQRAVDQVAHKMLLVEVRDRYSRYLQVLETFNALRAELIAAYLTSGRDALEAREWLGLDRPAFSLQELGAGGIGFNTPVDILREQQMGLLDEDRCRHEQVRIRQSEADWRARLETIASGDAD
jgi:hypothetical protein